MTFVDFYSWTHLTITYIYYREISAQTLDKTNKDFSSDLQILPLKEISQISLLGVY